MVWTLLDDNHPFKQAVSKTIRKSLKNSWLLGTGQKTIPWMDLSKLGNAIQVAWMSLISVLVHSNNPFNFKQGQRPVKKSLQNVLQILLGSSIFGFLL